MCTVAVRMHCGGEKTDIELIAHNYLKLIGNYSTSTLISINRFITRNTDEQLCAS